MNTNTTLPPKGKPVRCTNCGLVASAPIVVAATLSETVTVPSGRCSNRKACDLRLLRKLNREKEAKS